MQLISIQLLRGLAALLVVFHHASWAIAQFGSHQGAFSSTPKFWQFGAFGVDIFFVISGFVMTCSATQNPEMTARKFWLARIVRVAPLYWIVTLLMFPLMRLRQSGVDFGFDYLLASLAFIPLANPLSGRIHPLVDQGWTLNYEMGFYLVFGLLLFASKYLRLVLIGAVFLALWGLGTVFENSTVLAFWKNPIVWEFGLGMLLGTFQPRFTGKGERWIGVLLPIGALLAFASPAEVPEGAVRLAWWGSGAFCIVLGALSLESLAQKGRHLFLTRGVAVLGDISYSLYLTHTFVTILLGVLLKRLSPSMLSVPLDWLCLVASSILAAALGYVVYVGIEKPLLRIGKQLTLRRRTFPSTSPVIEPSK